MEEKKLAPGVREPLPYPRIFASLVIATIAFSILFGIAYSVSYLNFEGVEEQNSLITRYLEDLDKYLQNISCDNDILYEASVRLDRVGSRIAILENRLGKYNSNVLEQKELYTQLEIKHYKMINILNKKCDEQFIPILFFYSNKDDKEKHKDRSEVMGFILSAFKQENPQRVMVYSFDADLYSQSVQELIQNFEIKDTPITIINDKEKLYVRHLNDLLLYL